MTIAAGSTVVASPSDGGTQYDTGPSNVSVTPSGTWNAGDLAVLIAARRSTDDFTMGNDGGQSWNAGTLRQSGTSGAVKVYWCRFNGTWSNNPSIVSIASATALISVVLGRAVPTSSTNTWALDVAESSHTFNAPTTPFDVTATGQTAVAASTITFAIFYSLDNNTWSLQSGGWTNLGNAQYRNSDPSAFRDQSLSIAYKVQTSAGATGNITNRQATLGGDAGVWIVEVFKEQSSGVTVASVGDALIHDGETSVTITGTSFGASQGAGTVIISPSDNIADGSAVAQTVTSWADTSIAFTADLSAFAYFTTLYAFVTNNGGSSNAAGFQIKREAWADISLTLKNLAGTAQASKSNIRYLVCPGDITQTPILSGTTEATDGSGIIALPTYVLTEGGALSPADEVWVMLAIDGASAALSPGTILKITPTYS